MLKPKKLNSITTRTRIGKIGPLPKLIRNRLGQRTEDGSPPGQNENVAGCCHPVAENVAALTPDHQRCSGCCHFSDFISVLTKQPAQGHPSKASVALFAYFTHFTLKITSPPSFFTLT
jgi:hypothetical protein